MSLLKSQAIQKALEGNWDEAIFLNKQLLGKNPSDIDTLNRLAFAYAICGKVKDSKETYQIVLHIDPANIIAQRNLKKLNGITISVKPSLKISTDMFLEESGKTKIVSLVNTAPMQKIKSLQIGQLLAMCIKRSKIFILDEQKAYIGMLPDDISRRLIKFLEGGNAYEVYVKSADKHSVVIFVKEIKRVAKFKDTPSFLFGDKPHLALIHQKGSDE
ncbi:MAG TPA: tetratricopeptide repeat protein [Patescibacteria group bacterium]|nr:tetratricopeptide repeat protein [Patescibacteria group bacterium]